MRVRTDGKQFALDGRPFVFRGVTYGTFRPREEDGARFPERRQAKLDFAAMHEAGFTVVRTYTAPTDDLVDLAADWDLRLLAGAFYPDWRYLVGASRRQVHRVLRDARAEVRTTARRLAGREEVLGLVLGNEIPADVVRWMGTDVVADAIEALTEVVREEDDSVLVTYANYPTAEYLPLESLDFLTFNVFLEQKADLRRYLTSLHHLAGDRPLVLGETGLDAGPGGPGSPGETYQAEVLDWQLETALERGVAGTCVFSWTDEWWVGEAAVEGWHFGLTREDRSPRPALNVVAGWNRKTVRDLRPDEEWPLVSVVVCAYNAEETIDECLSHTTALDYPNLEIIVVDDGSTDETVALSTRYPRARVLTIPHRGLSVARNEGIRAASGRIIAYLDSDAYPAPDWLYYLVLGFDSATVGGAGGPNVPPLDDPFGAQQVARAPGGPVHVLLTDDRAEHVPGCNMAFWKTVLEEVGGFDPVYTSAGDDVDVCWKVLDRDWEIAFHPAALVWHHRRSGVRNYLRQQRGYGRAEALVEARHPDRFTPVGTARWRGRLYDFRPAPLAGQRVYRGAFGTAAYQSVYRSRGHTLDLSHQIGVPIALGEALTLPLGLVAWIGLLPGLLGLGALAVLAAIDVARADPPRGLRRRRLSFRLGVAFMQLAQPVVRSWARARQGVEARRRVGCPVPLPAATGRGPGGTLLYPATGPRAEFAAAAVAVLRRAGFRVAPVTGWERHDGAMPASLLLDAMLLTGSFPEGCVQLQIRRRLRWPRVWPLATAAAVLGAAVPVFGVALVLAALCDIAIGRARTGARLRTLLAAGA